MPSSYTGNPAATEAPSPTPGLGVVPIGALPVDGTDDVNLASIVQPFKVGLDFIAWIQGALNGLFTGILSLKALKVDGVGHAGAALAPGNLQTSGDITCFGSIGAASAITATGVMSSQTATSRTLMLQAQAFVPEQAAGTNAWYYDPLTPAWVCTNISGHLYFSVPLTFYATGAQATTSVSVRVYQLGATNMVVNAYKWTNMNGLAAPVRTLISTGFTGGGAGHYNVQVLPLFTVTNDLQLLIEIVPGQTTDKVLGAQIVYTSTVF